MNRVMRSSAGEIRRHHARPDQTGRGLSLGAIYRRLLAHAGIGVNGPETWDMQVDEPRLWRRIALGGSLALGDAYVEGWWHARRLDEFFARLIGARLDARIFNLAKLLAGARATLANLQDLTRARRVAEVHYDLGNDFYRAMLGPDMVYSCGYWRTAATLDEAQRHKLDLVCRKMELEPGMRVLDIGCGWGSFARYAAQTYDAEVVGVTISEQQARLARDACRDLPVTIRVQDYREVEGRFDRVVSIGMFEHVGRKNYRRFMELASQRLGGKGLLLLHTIGRSEHGSGIDPWVTRYVFPNSEVPTVGRLTTAFDGLMQLEDWHSFGADYDPTLMAWYDNFAAEWPRFRDRFGERFRRLWTYYLMMFAGVFRARGLNVWQLVLSPGGVGGGYRRPHF